MIASTDNSSATWPGTATVVIRFSITDDDITAYKQIELERELALERIRDEGRGRFPWEAIGPDAAPQRPQEALRVVPKDFARRRAPWQRDRSLARESAPC